MKRNELQELASERLKEAQALLGAGFWSGAYYLSGYSIEFALKACIARQFQAGKTGQVSRELSVCLQTSI